jgi:hypothetical protein
VDKGFLGGALHRYGGILFSLLGLGFLLLILLALKESVPGSRAFSELPSSVGRVRESIC